MNNRYLKEEFEKNIPDRIKTALKFCAEAADEKALPIFLIGGIVRDIIISKKNFDVDITVQGNAVEFAYFLQDKYPGICRVKETHDCFGTAKILFDINSESIALDLASTRKEYYPYSSSLPVIEETGCNLYEDVIRRDFTINSMALSLNKDSFYLLVDYLGGYDDLKKGILEILHSESFIDDPTRIIRGLKFSVRFGYNFGDKTRRLMIECLNSGRFDNLGGERVKLELKQAFNINRAGCLSKFINENIYRLVDTEIPVPENIHDLAHITQNTVKDYCNFLHNPDKTWLIYMGVLLAGEAQRKIGYIAEKMYLSGQEENILQGAAALCKKQEILDKSQTRFEVYEFFERSETESILVFFIKNTNLKDKVDLYLNELKNIKISIDGNTLIKIGLNPGPVFGEILKKVLKAKINKEITSPDQEMEFAKNLINPNDRLDKNEL